MKHLSRSILRSYIVTTQIPKKIYVNYIRRAPRTRKFFLERVYTDVDYCATNLDVIIPKRNGESLCFSFEVSATYVYILYKLYSTVL